MYMLPSSLRDRVDGWQWRNANTRERGVALTEDCLRSGVVLEAECSSNDFSYARRSYSSHLERRRSRSWTNNSRWWSVLLAGWTNTFTDRVHVEPAQCSVYHSTLALATEHSRLFTPTSPSRRTGHHVEPPCIRVPASGASLVGTCTSMLTEYAVSIFAETTPIFFFLREDLVFSLASILLGHHARSTRSDASRCTVVVSRISYAHPMHGPPALTTTACASQATVMGLARISARASLSTPPAATQIDAH
ncbi:hypothetical protein MSAN_00599500 [Mycena sanguinolenta]|uniref:Uncharacterized protein n=1 Tax=Mycena sanguinolenta TaxID=230812 RepID=A0A8H7DIV1_9AGAR|nr:hypothetical protein MSAN_00599500 [Mycena sanguinolenta]